MRTYTVYFEFMGKKLRKEVIAVSEEAAQQIVANSFRIHKVESTPEVNNESNEKAPAENQGEGEQAG